MTKEEAAYEYSDYLNEMINGYPLKATIKSKEATPRVCYKGKQHYAGIKKISILVEQAYGNIRETNFYSFIKKLENLEFGTNIIFVRESFKPVLSDHEGPTGVHKWYVQGEMGIMTLTESEERKSESKSSTVGTQSPSRVGQGRTDNGSRDYPEDRRKERTKGNGSGNHSSYGA